MDFNISYFYISSFLKIYIQKQLKDWPCKEKKCNNHETPNDSSKSNKRLIEGAHPWFMPLQFPLMRYNVG